MREKSFIILMILVQLLGGYLAHAAPVHGWTCDSHQGSCYMIKKGTFDELIEACAKEGATIASIHSADENRIVQDLTVGFAYIGLIKLNEQMNFEWIDGSPSEFLNWEEGCK